MKIEPREVWADRVRRLMDSGLTAKEFASEIGVNPHTLAGWKWRLNRVAAERPASAAPKPQFVDVTAALTRAPTARAAASVGHPEPFEVVLLSGARIRVPATFDSASLRALVAALEVA